MDKMFEGMRVVEFIVLLVERIASRFRGVIVSHKITTDGGGENITISLVFCLPKKQNVTLQSWFRAAMQVFKLSHRLWKHEPACGRDSSPSVKHATPSVFGVGPLRAMPEVGGPHHGVGAWPCLAAVRYGMSGLLWLVGV